MGWLVEVGFVNRSCGTCGLCAVDAVVCAKGAARARHVHECVRLSIARRCDSLSTASSSLLS